MWIIAAIWWVACKWTMAANRHHLMKIYITGDSKSATCSKDFWKWIHKRTATSCFNLPPFDCRHQTVGLQMDKNLMEKEGRKKKTNPNLLWLPISTLKVEFRTENHPFCQNITTVGLQYAVQKQLNLPWLNQTNSTGRDYRRTRNPPISKCRFYSRNKYEKSHHTKVKA